MESGMPEPHGTQDVSPSGWSEVPLQQVASYINGRAFKPTDWNAVGLPIIRIQNLTNPSTPFHYYSKPVDEKYLVKNGDLLVSWSATLDAFIWNRGDAILNQHIFKVETEKDSIDKEFLFYAIKWILRKIILETHGSTMKHITKGKLEAMKIPLPPMQEQLGIVSRIEDLTRRIGVIKTVKTDASIQVRTILDSALSSCFNEEFENNWGLKRLDSSFKRIDSGMTPRKRGDNYVEENKDGIPLIQVRHIMKDGTIQVTNENPRINRALHEGEMKRSQVSSGAILVNIVGPPLGKIGLVSDGTLEANINQAIVAIRDPIDCSPDYVFYCLRSPRYNSQLVRLGIGARQANINVSQVREFMIPVPPTLIQTKIVTKLDELRNFTRRLGDLENDGLECIDRLTDLILEKAFRGHLIK